MEPLRSIRSILALTLMAACLFLSHCKWVVTAERQNKSWSLTDLKNATYSGLRVDPHPVTLVDGRWEGAVYVAGGASRPSVHFAGDFYHLMPRPGRHSEAAVVFLSESSGGSGTFLYLAVLEKKNGKLVNTATAPVGDRVQIRDVRTKNGTIAVDVLQAGPQDAACCPGELATRQWEFRANQLVELNEKSITSRLSLDVIAGVTWELRTWNFNEPAPDEPIITLTYIENRLAGSTGCNHYVATIEADTAPGSLQVGPFGSTRKICPQPIMAVEQRFLKQLEGVRKLGFMAGQLVLSFVVDGQWGTMRFDRK